MKKLFWVFATSLLGFMFLISCKSANESLSKEVYFADSTSIVTNSSPQVSNIKNPENNESRKVIRRAEFKLKVKNVEQSILKLENIARSLGGFIEYSNIQALESNTATAKISEDTLLQIVEYGVEGNIILRVPSSSFDSSINKVQQIALFLNYRRTSNEDISFQYKANELKSQASQKSQRRVEDASGRGKKLDDIVNAEQTAALLAENAIDKQISNLEMQRKVDFSSITVDLYQAHTIYKERIVNYSVDDYQPGIIERAGRALRSGWNGLVSFLIFLLNIWPLLITAIVVFIILKGFKIRFISSKK